MPRRATKKKNKVLKVQSAKARAAKRKESFESKHLSIPEGTSQFKFTKAGVYLLDVIPYIVGEGNPFAEKGSLHYERTYYAHKSVGPNNDMVICPAKTVEQSCPICEFRNKLRKKDDLTDEEEKMLKDLSPKERQLFCVIDRKNPDKGIQILDISHYLFGKILDARIGYADEDDGYDLFHDLENGYTLKLGVSEESFNGASFYKVESIDFKPRKVALDPELYEEAPCLDDLLKVIEYEPLKEMFLEAGDGSTTTKKKSARKSSRKKKDEEEDLDDDEEDEEDEDDLEDEEDLDDDEDDLEDEEDLDDDEEDEDDLEDEEDLDDDLEDEDEEEDLDEEDEDDLDDDEWDDEEDEEDEEPPAKKKSSRSSKKSPPAKKKAAPRKRSAKKTTRRSRK